MKSSVVKLKVSNAGTLEAQYLNPQRGEGGGRRPPTERRRGPEGPESTEQSLK